MVKNPPVNAGDMDLIPGSGRFLAEGNGTHSSILTWEVPWTEEPGSLQFMGSQKNQTQLNNKFSKEYFHCRFGDEGACLIYVYVLMAKYSSQNITITQ